MERVHTTMYGIRARLHRLPAAIVRAGRVPLALGAALLVGSTVSVLATTNTPPQITSLTLSPAVANEGQTVTLTGAFADPDPADLHSVLIYWPDDHPGLAEHVRLTLGARSFQVTHTFPDDVPPTNFKVDVLDHQSPFGSNDNVAGGGRDERTVSLQVKNVPPTFAPGVTLTGPDKTGHTTIDGTVIDPGTDRVAVGVDWGDGSTPPPPVPLTIPQLPGNLFPCTIDRSRQFHCEHAYNVKPLFPPRPLAIKLIAKDDDGGSGLFTITGHTP
jgi:hypothetical protein